MRFKWIAVLWTTLALSAPLGSGCGRTWFDLDLAECGNGVVEAGEECDDGNTDGGDACQASCLLARCGDGDLWVGVEQCDDGNTLSGDGCSATCEAEEALCGNGIIEAGEECDDGNTLPFDGCDPVCQIEGFCGNGIIEAGEECDDGNTLPFDGCDAFCRFEFGECGNGIIEAGEECDDGNFSNNDDCMNTCLWARCGDAWLWAGVEQCDDGNTFNGDGCDAFCRLEGSTCGNGVLEPGEECDDGNLTNNDGCLSTCQNARCGDGFLWVGAEQCDDGNTFNGDGCDSGCQFEFAVCGNGVLEPGEQCDDGNANNTDACLSTCRNATCGDGAIWSGFEECDDGNQIPGDGCDSQCRRELAVCGNGVTEPGEQCDDGNLLPGDGCDADCLLETFICGNGVVEPGEQCDDGNSSNNDGCLTTCQNATCGDGRLWIGVEQCDDGNLLPGDGCSPLCRLETVSCGNGVVEPGEQCDDGNTADNDACLSTCQNARCGDGFLWLNVEQCDDGNLQPGDGCSPLCQTEGAVCGDGVQEAGEQCDDGNASNSDECLNSCQWASCGDGYIHIFSEQCDDGNTTSGDGCDGSCQLEQATCVPDWAYLTCGTSDNWSTQWGNFTTAIASYPCTNRNESGNEYTYTFEAVQSGQVTVDLSTQGNLDLDLFILGYGGGVCDGDNCLDWGNHSVTWNAVAGETYFIVVDGHNGAAGEFQVDMTCSACGNGVTDPGEQCDDGNASNTDACLTTCQNATCGDGNVWAGVEQCDDGNTTNGDGCDATCRLETATCGNGVPEPGEQCDDGNAANNDSCLITCVNATCGDGFIWAGVEQCDDGNVQPGDGCSPTCDVEVPVCGNGVPEPGEQCDDGNASNNDACLTSCRDAGCGDGHVWTGVEQCDDGNTANGDGCDATCQFEVAVCGNGIPEAGEQCDDGNASNTDACLTTCRSADCGDGHVWAGMEQCDDGNTTSGDGCDATCRLEVAVCGNGVPEPGEQCDDGNASNTDACLATCQDATCGDWFLWTGVEQCDDGNTTNGDGCSATCQLEVAVCGNGIPEPGEQCDDGNASNTDSCLSSCRNAACGDGFIWSGVEQCDDGNTLPGDGCDGSCRFETAVCGNGIPEPGEQCDDGNASNTDSCLSTCQNATCGDWFLWNGVEQCDDGNTTPGDGCDESCRFETAVCGNGIPEPGEECDDGNLSNNDDCLSSCQDAECGDGHIWTGLEQCDDGNTTPGDGCDESCRLETSTCGNGTTEPGEECDDGNLSNNDDCLNSCVNATCGDGHIWVWQEECDDGNTLPGDGCDDSCSVEDPTCVPDWAYLSCGGSDGWSTTAGGATNNIDAYPCSGRDETGPEYTYTFTAAADGPVTVNLTSAEDLDLYVLSDTGGICDPDNCVDWGDNTVTFNGEENKTYYIVVDGHAGAAGDYQVDLVCQGCGNGIPEAGEECDDGNPDNDDACLNNCTMADCGDGFVWNGVEQCDDGNTTPGDGCDANCQWENPTCEPDWELTCGGADNWSTEQQGATDQVDSYSCVGWDMSGPEYTYSFVAPDSQEVTVNLTPQAANLDVFVLTAGANGECDPTSCIAFGNNGATFQSVAGQTYYIVVDGRNGASGPYAVDVTCSSCGNGVMEGAEECDDGAANETRYALRAWQPGGMELAIQPIEQWQDSSAYYGWVSASAHTGYEAVGRSLAFLYRDRGTGILSLFVVHGIDFDTSGQHQPTAEVIFDLSGFPVGTTLNRSDDVIQGVPEFVQTGPTSYQGDWWFQDNTDGGVVSDIAFPGTWTITIDPTWEYGLSEWVWVDDDGQFHTLDMSQPLYIAADPVASTCRDDCTLPLCGDDILDAGEVCDDGNTTGGDGCAADCQSVL